MVANFGIDLKIYNRGLALSMSPLQKSESEAQIVNVYVANSRESR